MGGLSTNDYGGAGFWQKLSQPADDDEEERFKFPLAIKSRRRGTSVGSVVSGASTPGFLGSKTLSAQDLDLADAALSQHQPNGGNGTANGNGH